MNVNLLPLVQGAGAVALAVVAFSFALTWPSLIAGLSGLCSVESFGWVTGSNVS